MAHTLTRDRLDPASACSRPGTLRTPAQRQPCRVNRSKRSSQAAQSTLLHWPHCLAPPLHTHCSQARAISGRSLPPRGSPGSQHAVLAQQGLQAPQLLPVRQPRGQLPHLEVQHVPAVRGQQARGGARPAQQLSRPRRLVWAHHLAARRRWKISTLFRDNALSHAIRASVQALAMRVGRTWRATGRPSSRWIAMSTITVLSATCCSAPYGTPSSFTCPGRHTRPQARAAQARQPLAHTRGPRATPLGPGRRP